MDQEGCDLLLDQGLVRELGPQLESPPGAIPVHRPGSVVAPCFLDLHCHLREPGEPWKERISRATAAAAAGGFGAVCAMANLVPPVDTKERLEESVRAQQDWSQMPILQFASCSEGLRGKRLTDFAALARAGAAAFSDDGRNGLSGEQLSRALALAGELDRMVAVHPEDEEVLAWANQGREDPASWRVRPAEAEEGAVAHAIGALRAAPGGRLHLQHVTTAAALERIRMAKADGLRVTAEATPHHLSLSTEGTDPRWRCNPPLRAEADRAALWQGLLDGTIDAVASDHAPHGTEPAASRPPGFSGTQLVLSALLSRAAPAQLPRILAALTQAPRRILGQQAEQLPGGAIQCGLPASLVWFDPGASWVPGPGNWLSLGSNTPLWDRPLRGLVLMTLAGGRLLHLDRRQVPELALG